MSHNVHHRLATLWWKDVRVIERQDVGNAKHFQVSRHRRCHGITWFGQLNDRVDRAARIHARPAAVSKLQEALSPLWSNDVLN